MGTCITVIVGQENSTYRTGMAAEAGMYLGKGQRQSAGTFLYPQQSLSALCCCKISKRLPIAPRRFE